MIAAAVAINVLSIGAVSRCAFEIPAFLGLGLLYLVRRVECAFQAPQHARGYLVGRVFVLMPIRHVDEPKTP